MTRILIFFSGLCLALSATAQTANSGCGNGRYKSDVFTGVTKKSGVFYAETVSQSGASQALYMDIYEPTGDDITDRPLVILAHGGSFIFGDKSDMDKWCRVLAKKGYVAATIQYRLYPVFILGLPDSTDIFGTAVRAMGDMKSAARFFREDAATDNEYKIDPNNIFVGGYSAGAVIALHAGLLDSTDVLPAFIQTIVDETGGLNGNTGTPANLSYSSKINAVLNMSGGLYRSTWVDADDIPIASIHGTNDETVPYISGLAADIAYLEGSKLIHDQANAVGVTNYLRTVPNGGHTDIYTQLGYQADVDSFWTNASGIMEKIICGTVGASEAFASAEPWRLAPNPLQGDAFTISLPDDVQTLAVRVLDLQGRVVVQARGVANNTAVQTGSLAPGVYLVQVVDEADPGRLFMVRRLVK